MSRVTDHVLEDIRRRIDIVELIGSRVTLKRAGSSFKACCPFHNEKTPSFHVNPARQSFHCFGCGAHGDIFGFLMKSDGLPFPDAIRTLAQRAGVTLDSETDFAAEARNALYAIHAELAAFYQRCLQQLAEARVARDYLVTRLLGPETITQFGIGYAPRAPDTLLRWGAKHGYDAEQLLAAGLLAPSNRPDQPEAYYDRFRSRLMFPIHDSLGRVVAFSGRILDPKAHPAKYVNSPETPIFVKSRILYALDKARAAIVRSPRREAIVCEGQIDVIRCHSAGFETAVAAQGTAFTREHAEILKRYADSAVLAFDGDGAGIKAAVRTGGIFLELGLPVRVVSLPAGADPDSLIRDQGGDAFRALLDSASSLTTFQIRTLRADERDPTAVDAVNRMARAALESIATCANAVLRSHLLQDAATGLSLPLSALSEDLEALRADQSQRAARTAPPSHQPTSVPEALGEAVVDEVLPERPLISRAEYGLCELLVHHEDDEHIPNLVQDYLPFELLCHPHAQAVTEAALAARRSGTDRLGELCAQGDPELQAFIAALVRGESRVLHARDATPRQAAEDLIVRLWADALSIERQALSAAEAPPAVQRRSELTLRLKALRQPGGRWLERERHLRAEIERRGLTLAALPAAVTAAPPAEPEPVARAADAAVATVAPTAPPPNMDLPEEF